MAVRVLSHHPAWPESLTVTDLDTALDLVPQAVAAGQSLTLPAPVRFGADGRRDAAVLRFLGEAAAHLVPVEWIQDGPLPWPLRLVIHLPPPAASPDSVITAWRAGYRSGLCTYRIGPGFVSVIDLRPNGPKASITVPEDWVDTFNDLATSLDAPDSGPSRLLLDRLVGAGLALRLGDRHSVLLPYRPRRWPVVHYTGLPNEDSD
jgi:hypothetical protein